MNRIVDVGVAAGGLAISLPLLVVLALIVKLDSPGPAFFVQTRVGKRRRPFRLVKLRTMTAGAPGAAITARQDPRITRVGALLRRTKLDEVPQLWNVLRGQMSLVGPRPEVPEYVEKYRAEWEPLFSVRPGLTDTASLTFRDEEHLLGMARDRERAYMEILMPTKLALALQDVRGRSLLHDVRVILRTAASVVRPKRADEDPVVLDVIRRILELNELVDP